MRSLKESLFDCFFVCSIVWGGGVVVVCLFVCFFFFFLGGGVVCLFALFCLEQTDLKT